MNNTENHKEDKKDNASNNRIEVDVTKFHAWIDSLGISDEEKAKAKIKFDFDLYREWLKTLSDNEIGEELTKTHDLLVKAGMSDKQIESQYKKFCFKKFLTTDKLPNLLIRAFQWFLIATKILGVQPMGSWSWWIILFPTILDFVMLVVWPPQELKDVIEKIKRDTPGL